MRRTLATEVAITMKEIWFFLSWAAVAGSDPGTGGAQEPASSVLYEKHCEVCHGPAGGAPAPALQKQMGVPNLFESGFLRARSDDSLVAVMERGAGKFMKPMAGTLKKEQMRAIARFLRASAEAPAGKGRKP